MYQGFTTVTLIVFCNLSVDATKKYLRTYFSNQRALITKISMKPDTKGKIVDSRCSVDIDVDVDSV